MFNLLLDGDDMIKLNKKGFMMAELIVVSSIILVTLVSLYTSYNKIYSIYNGRIGYYDVATLYRLSYYRDVLNKYDLMDDAKDKALNNKIVTVYNNKAFNGLFLSLPGDVDLKNVEDTVFLVYNNKNNIDSSIFNDVSGVKPTFKDYVDYLKDSIDFSSFEYMLIMERCNLDASGNENIDSCNYSYLEIYPESELDKTALSVLDSYKCLNISVGKEPYMLNYTGKCSVHDDENGHWRVKFLTSGILTMAVDMKIDAFLVGGGGRGGHRSSSTAAGGGGGGGGYAKTISGISISSTTSYTINIGAGGSATSAFDNTANAGGNGSVSSGGSGSGRGGDGGEVDYWGRIGSGDAGSKGVYEFNGTSGTVYGSGGGGGGAFDGGSGGTGGTGGGGTGGTGGYNNATAGTANTGGGGGGAGGYGGSGSGQGGANGGSGIVVIRNARSDTDDGVT